MLKNITSLDAFTYDEKYLSYDGETRDDKENKIHLYISFSKDQTHTDSEVIERISSLINWINDNNVQISQYVTDKMHDIYEDNWNEGEKITPEAFASHLQIIEIASHPDDSASLFFSCGDLFLGHDIEVRIDANRNFTETALAG